jgi:hypothetical protein
MSRRRYFASAGGRAPLPFDSATLARLLSALALSAHGWQRAPPPARPAVPARPEGVSSISTPTSVSRQHAPFPRSPFVQTTPRRGASCRAAAGLRRLSPAARIHLLLLAPFRLQCAARACARAVHAGRGPGRRAHYTRAAPGLKKTRRRACTLLFPPAAKLLRTFSKSEQFRV